MTGVSGETMKGCKTCDNLRERHGLRSRVGFPCDICDGRGVDYLGRDCRHCRAVTHGRQPCKTQTGEGTEWNHRWIVRGHWRNQWYPSTQVHRPKYVPSYVKGPEDKPLIVHDKIFSVDR